MCSSKYRSRVGAARIGLARGEPILGRGKCGVKKGSFDDLRPKAEALIDRGIQATIDY